MRMESILLFHTAQMPVAGVPDRNRCRLYRDNVLPEVPGKKDFRQNKCIRHTPDCRLRHNGATRILWAFFEGKYWSRKKHGSGLQNAANYRSRESNSNNMSPYCRVLTTVPKQKSRMTCHHPAYRQKNGGGFMCESKLILRSVTP